MNNYYLNSSNGSNTPVKRLGLSRKRKSLVLTRENMCSECSASTTAEAANQDPSENKVKKHKLESTDYMKNSESLEKEQNIKSRTENQTVSIVQIPQHKGNDMESMNDKIKDLENLYLIWKDGFKNSLLYLVKLLKERQGESVDLRKLLSDLRILDKVRGHFKNDADLDIFICDD